MNEQQTLDMKAVSRRRFLGYAGALAGAGIAASMIGCSKDPDPMEGAINLGTGDFGVLNLAFVIEQVQAAFYTQIILKPYEGLKPTDREYALLLRMRDHEIAHREFLRKVLGIAAIQNITPDFSGILMDKRTSVLDNAKLLKDVSVTAYNGIGQLLTNDVYLNSVASIGSVEARHSVTIRNLIEFGTFASSDVVDDGNGLDGVRNVEGIIVMITPFVKEKLNPSSLPTS